MDTSLKRYTAEIEHELERLEAKPSKAKAEDLYFYHIDRVHDFQHERLVHLLVTFFFALLLVFSVVGLLWAAGMGAAFAVLTYLFSGAGIILFITILFYIRYYYRLENGTQRLYVLTERLRMLLKS